MGCGSSYTPAYQGIGVAFPCAEVNIANGLDRGFAVLQTPSSATHVIVVGAGTISYLTADPTLKLGLTNWVDFEVVLNGYLNSSTHDNLTGVLVSNGHGFGDTIFKIKFNVLGNDGGAVLWH
jgi:hypothetical protein